jgi:hypothetical protein
MSEDDMGVLFHEEFSDSYTEAEISAGVLDKAIAHAISIGKQQQK